MKVHARFHGILAEWIAAETAEFDLEPEATYGDLLKEISSRFGSKMSPQLWDHEKLCFSSSVLVLGEGRRLSEEDDALRPDEEITFYMMLAGG